MTIFRWLRPDEEQDGPMIAGVDPQARAQQILNEPPPADGDIVGQIARQTYLINRAMNTDPGLLHWTDNADQEGTRLPVFNGLNKTLDGPPREATLAIRNAVNDYNKTPATYTVDGQDLFWDQLPEEMRQQFAARQALALQAAARQRAGGGQ